MALNLPKLKLPALPKLPLLGTKPEGILGLDVERPTAMTTTSMFGLKEKEPFQPILPALPKLPKITTLKMEALPGAVEMFPKTELREAPPEAPEKDTLFKKALRFVLPKSLELKFKLRKPTTEEEIWQKGKDVEEYYGRGEDLIGGIKTFGQGLLKLPKATAVAVLQSTQGYEGASVVDKDWADRYIEDAKMDLNMFISETAEKYKSKTLISGLPLKITDVAELPQNLAFSIASMGAGLGVGVPIGLIPLPGARVTAWALGTAASGKVAYEMTTYEIMQQYLELENEKKITETGEGITAEEEKHLKDLFGAKAMEYGLWEAIPEAISNLGFVAILTAPLQKIVGKSMAANILSKITALYGEELLTETVTQKGQSDIEVEAGLREGKIGWIEAFKEIAPQTFLLTTVMAGAGSVVVNTSKVVNSLENEIGKVHPLFEQLKSYIEETITEIQTRPEAGFVKLPGKEPVKPVGKAPAEKGIIPKELQPLAQEARKYKSAEEFVDKEAIYFHGTKSKVPFSEFKDQPDKNFSTFSFTKNKVFAEKFGRVEKYNIDVKNTFDFRNENHLIELKESLGEDFSILEKRIRKGDFEAIEQGRVLTALDSAGFDSFLTKETFKGETAINIGVFDKNLIKTEQQLTDFYNQAVKGVEEVKPEVPPVKPPTKFERKVLGIPEERMIIKPETTLLKMRIRAEAKGTKEGFKVARQITRKEMTNAFKDSAQKARDTKAILREYIQQQIPLEQQGKFLTALTNDITKKKQVKIMTRVDELRENIKVRQIIGELKEVPKGNIAVDYQKKIEEMMKGIDLVKPTERTLTKLKGLRDYISREGIPLGISQNRLDALDRLTKKSVATMTPKELVELKDTIQVLRKLGKLKYDLKFKYNERERKVALDKLLASSRNIDPKVKPVEGKLGTFDIYKVGTAKAYIETLTPARIADTIDGFQNYAGENAKYVKRLVAKETQAKKETQDIVIEALTEIQDLGIKELTPDQQLRMMINIRHREGAYDQVQTLLEKNKMTEIPKITEAEEKVIQILQKYTNKHTSDMAAISEEIENKIFRKIDGYVLPLKYEGEFNILPSETIEQTRYRTTQTFKGFIYGRQKGVTKTPRTDIFGIFDEAINEQQWYIRIQPELENIKYLVRSKEYVEKAGELASNTFWRSFMDVVARRGWGATAQSNPILRSTRINIGQAVLGYKLTSFLMQPFAIFDALAYAQSKYGATAAMEALKEFSKSWIVPKYSQKIIKESPALQLRKGGEVAIEEIYDALKKEPTGRIAKLIPPTILKGLRAFKRKGLVALQWGDVKTAAGVQKGIEDILIKRGVANPKEESEFLMNMVSASSEVTMRPLILSKGEGARTVFTFQTFFLNRWGLLAHDLIRSGLISGKLKANWGKRFSALIGLAIMAAAGIAEQRTRDFILGMISGKKPKPKSTLSLAITAIPEQIPLFGNMISSFINYGNSGFDFPLARQAENIIGGIGVVTKKTEEAKAKATMRAAEAGITVVGGIPGTTQFFDILESIFFKEKKEKAGMGLPGLPALPKLPSF